MELKGWDTTIKNNTWFDAENIVISKDNDMIMVEGKSTFFSNFPNHDIIGTIPINNGIIFFTSLLEYSYIYKLDNKGTLIEIVKSKYLNFSLLNPIAGIHVLNNRGETIIIFWEGNRDDCNHPRLINLDIIGNIGELTESDVLSLKFTSRALGIPMIQALDGSGILQTGKYKVGIQYISDIGYHDILYFSKPVMLFDHAPTASREAGTNSGKGLNVYVENLNLIYKEYRIVVIASINAALTCYATRKFKTTSGVTNISIPTINDLEVYSISDALISNVEFDTFEDATIMKDRLVVGSYRLKGSKDNNLQGIVNELKLKVEVGYGHGLMLGEVYDLYIRFYSAITGQTEWFHIPGPELNGEFFDEPATNHGYPNITNPYYTIGNTCKLINELQFTTGYYPNKYKTYSDKFPNIGGQYMRFHKMPTMDYLASIEGELGPNMCCGLAIDNIEKLNGIPYEYYEFGYLKRDFINSNVIIQDVFNVEQFSKIKFKAYIDTTNGFFTAYYDDFKLYLSTQHLDLVHNSPVDLKGVAFVKYQEGDIDLDKFKVFLDSLPENPTIEDVNRYPKEPNRITNISYESKAYYINSKHLAVGQSVDDLIVTPLINLDRETRYLIDVDHHVLTDKSIYGEHGLAGHELSFMETVVRNERDYYKISYGRLLNKVVIGAILNLNTKVYMDSLIGDIIPTNQLTLLSDNSYSLNFDVISAYNGLKHLEHYELYDYKFLTGPPIIYPGLPDIKEDHVTYSYIPYIGVSNPALKLNLNPELGEIRFPNSIADIINPYKGSYFGYNIDANAIIPLETNVYNPDIDSTYIDYTGLYFSNVYSKDSTNLGLNVFKSGNRINSNSTSGKILRVIFANSLLVVIHNHNIIIAYSDFKLNAQSSLLQVSSIDFNDLQLKSLIEDIGVLSIKSKFDIFNNQFGIFIVSREHKEILKFAGEKITKLTDSGLYYYFKSNFENLESGITGIPTVQIIQDWLNDRLIFSYKQGGTYLNLLSYNTKHDYWICKHTEDLNIMYTFNINSIPYAIIGDDRLTVVSLSASSVKKQAYVILSYVYNTPVNLTSILGKIVSLDKNQDEAPIPYSIQVITRQGISDEIILDSKNYYTKNYSLHNGDFRINDFINILIVNSPSIIALDGSILSIDHRFIEKAWYKRKNFKAKEILILIKFTNGKNVGIDNIKLLN